MHYKVKNHTKNIVTIKSIANQLNLNVSTVSRALNDFPNIKDGTKKKVLRLANKMNYLPNNIAKGLMGKGTKIISLIAPTLNPHVLPVIKGVTDACKKMGYALMLFPTDYWADEVTAFVDIKKKWLVDGMLIYNVIYYSDIEQNIKKLKEEKIPFVFINKFLGSKKVNTVSVDNYDAVNQAIRHLYSLGRKSIGIINGNLASNDGTERFEAYKSSLKELNLKYKKAYVGYGEYGEEIAYSEMKKMLLEKPLPKGLFCASDLMAIGAIKAIKESSLKVPDDIAVIGFDDIALGRYTKPSLTTIRAPLEDSGAKAAELLRRVIEDPGRPTEEIPLKGRLIIRESSR